MPNLVGAANKNGKFYAFERGVISNGPIWEDQIAAPGRCPLCGEGAISSAAWNGSTLFIAGGHTTINGTACLGSVQAVNPATWLGRIAPMITPMLLTKSRVSQAGSNITFQVTYSDSNNLPATQAALYIDGAALPQQMTYVSGLYNTGAIYHVTTTLSPGAHSLYYLFSDGQTSWALQMAPGSIGFNVSAASAAPHSIALNIPAFDTSNLLSSLDDPDDLG